MSETTGIKFVSRYDFFGPPNDCEDQCEGTGWIPIFHPDWESAQNQARPLHDEDEPVFLWLWIACETVSEKKSEDGYWFVPCPSCNLKGMTKLIRRMQSVGQP